MTTLAVVEPRPPYPFKTLREPHRSRLTAFWPFAA